MKDIIKDEHESNQIIGENIFLVPFTIEEINENIFISDNTSKQHLKNKIINQAFNFHSRGKIIEATKYYEHFIEQGFKDYHVFSNYGVILKDLGKLEEAELYQRKAIEINPDFPDAHSNLGNILRDLGKLEEAELYCRKAIELKPDFPEAHSNLGIILSDLGNLKEAELYCRKAIELKLDYAEPYFNLGNILRELGRLEDAELAFRKAIGFKPDYGEAYYNLGNILRDLGKSKEAEISIVRSTKLISNFNQGYFSLSYVQLLRGNYESGLINYEYRNIRNNNLNIHAKPSIEKFCNSKFKKGEKLLVVSEQGIGDTLQFMRYIPHLRNLGLYVSFCAQTKLHSLIKQSGIDSNPLTPDDAKNASEGQWIALISLLRYLKINPNNPQIINPYIFSTDELIYKWKNILKKEERPIIGINWQGNPDSEKGSQKGRSFPLETFSIAAKDNFKFLSLQKGFGSEQLEHCSFKNKFVRCQSQIDHIWDFLENASIISCCDLIITCDTSIAHLAAGMGKPTWLLLKNIHEWR